MDSKKLHDDDGVIHIQRLNPGQVDVVLGSHPRRKPLPPERKSRPVTVILACLGVIGITSWLSASLLDRPEPAVVLPSAPLATEPPPALPAAQPIASEPARPVAQLASYVPPQPAAQEPTATPKPLDNCIKHGNVIDESVLNCRFGETPRPTQTEPAKGMVSSSYMADFKSGASRKAEQRPSKSYTVVSMSIREWDGSDRYRAQWRQYDNRIDQDSVCENFLSRSVERRECRKSAQVHFKELCREWSKRAARDRDEKSNETEQRYCEVAGTFAP